MTDDQRQEWEAWIKSRPEPIQNLAREFPIGTQTNGPNGEMLYLVGYSEPDKLIFSSIKPNQHNLDEAMRHAMYVCAQHLRDNWEILAFPA